MNYFTTVDKLIEFGFIQEDDGSGDPRGVDWNYRINGYHIYINAFFDVLLIKDSSSCDSVKIVIENLSDLENLMSFIKEIS